MSNSKLTLDLVSQVLSKTLPHQIPAFVGQAHDSSLFLADYDRYNGAQIREHENQFHTLEIMGINSITPHKRRMGDYKTENPLKGGEVCFCPAQDGYSLDWDNPVDFTLIALDTDITSEIAEARFGASQLTLIPKMLGEDIYPIKEIINIIRQEIALGYPNGDLFSESMRNSLVIAILNKFAIEPVTLTNIDNLSNNKIKLIQDYIQEHLNKNLTLEDLAKLVHISKYHLCRSFKQATGTTITDYIISERVKLAQKLLISGSLNIAQIADDCGFHDASHLNRHFKLLTKTTPTAFRKNCTNLT
ncbi:MULTISPECIES: AraC family transcriptional regulator [Pseudanabaena]|uniref:Transcriptional regulator, AraC family n=2 Tax=Pseudanabaena TaxID=1152 RepID=L8N160_9CYAN|nr:MULTISPECIES: AraC family transcriptional regulator [Pseudanabaena]ELS32774.1 transcriptional regulator, AraC family [Pseudanabaena biceps PCC 7429]MDG3495001.1 AraC family transcriptional regulator [Pseudanabaena catenata USMAC16]